MRSIGCFLGLIYSWLLGGRGLHSPVFGIDEVALLPFLLRLPSLLFT